MSDEYQKVEEKARSDMENAAAGPSQVQQAAAVHPLTPSILKLDVDCFEELFEWLSLAQLRALRRTCKRLKQVVEYFLRIYYPAVKIGLCSIMLTERNIDKIKELDPISVKTIKKVRIWIDKMTLEQIDSIKGMLPQLQRLQFAGTELQTNFFESILKWCSNLKYLAIDNKILNMQNPEDNDWLLHSIPSMERLRINYRSNCPAIKELMTFVQINPNIQTLTINSGVFKAFGNCFAESNINIKIDRLNFCLTDVHDAYGTCHALNKLYELESYKRLHLEVYVVYDQAEMDLIALTSGLEKLHFDCCHGEPRFTLPPTPCLQELCYVYNYGDFKDVDMEFMAKNLTNLERIYIYRCKVRDIIPFIRYSPKIKEIKVQWLEPGVCFRKGIINLLALNEKREHLAGACNVTIYVEERIFLKTKFATTKTEFNLITLKRGDGVEWSYDLE